MKAVIFDMDGVIFDTEHLMFSCWQEAAAKRGFGDITELYNRLIGCSTAYCKDLVESEYPGLGSFDEISKDANDLFLSHIQKENIPLKPFAGECLQVLKEDGFRIGLASSTVKALVVKELIQTNLMDFFDVVIGGDEIEHSKPAPDIFEKAVTLLGTQPDDTYVIEDSLNGIRAAHAAGLRPVMVPDMQEPTEEIRHLADIILPDLKEATKYVLYHVD